MPQPKTRRLIIIFISIISLIAVGLIDSIIQRKQKLVGAGITKAFLFVLINLHIILAGLLLFLIVRHSIKLYSEHRAGIPGAVFKRNLLFAFTLFSIIPALFVFFTAGSYITSNIDRWFQARVSTGFTSGKILHEAHTALMRQQLGAYGKKVCDVLRPMIISFVGPYSSRQRFHVPFVVRNESCECLESMNGGNRLLTKNGPIPEHDQTIKIIRNAIAAHKHPAYIIYLLSADGDDGQQLSRSFDHEVGVWRSFRLHNDRSMHSLKQAFTREITQLGPRGNCFDFYGSLYWACRLGDWTLIIAARYPKELRCALIDAQNAQADYEQLMEMRKSIKLNYTFTFALLTLLIVFLAIWCAFYLARGMAMPIQDLLRATEAMHRGDLTVTVNDYPSSDLRPLLMGFNQMSAALKKSYEDLEAKNDEMSAMIEHLTVSIFVLNRFGRIIKANAAAGQLAQLYLGYSDVTGMRINLFGPQIMGPCSAMVRSLLSAKQLKTSSQVAIQVHNEQRTIMLHVSTMSLQDGSTLLLAIEDITAVVKTNKLKTWQEAAQQIAHEIKNPLTPIQLATQRMQRKYGQTLSGDPLFVQSTQTILDQVKIIQDLVNHFSAFASMPKLSLEQTNVGELIGDIVGFYTLSYQDITFLASIDPVFVVITDKKKLTRAIVNIIDNSIQALATLHSDDKQKWISIAAQPSFDMQALLITIIDNGAGIPPEIRDKLFLPYVSSGKKNMGLGLAIVQDIMQQLGGSVSVVPQKHGAGFRLTVPLTRP